MNLVSLLFLMFCGLTCLGTTMKQRITVVDSYDPGLCDEKAHGQQVLVKDKTDEEIILICVKDKGVYHWRPTFGLKNTVGEFYNPGDNCADVLDKLEEAEDGFYWIKLLNSKPQKVWCDMTTDGGGFMLIGYQNTSETWKIPSSDVTVEPYGEPHWSSSFGDLPILDFRVQMATSEDFKATKAHWSYRLQSRRALKNLMMNTAGCDQRSAGIGNVAYVKDLMTERIATTNLRCSKFGIAYNRLFKFGWHKMNSCLQKPCPLGFAFHDVFKIQVDSYGGFSFSSTRNISGMEYQATAFVGCDNGHCCGCYGPEGGSEDYCTENCQAVNGGTVTKNVFTWFWVRSSLPKRLWKKCMDYEVKRDDGKVVSYKLVGHSVLPVEGRCGKDATLLHDGLIVVPDSSSAQKVPAVDGLLEYRKDKQELYVRSNKTWNVLAKEDQVQQQVDKKYQLILDKIEKLEQNIQLEETGNKYNSTLDKIKKLEQNIQKVSADQKYNSHLVRALDSMIHDLPEFHTRTILPEHKECFGYKWLKESSRNRKNSGSPRDNCDRILPTGWYRFGGGAGTKMPTSCVPMKRCGTEAAGWMNDAHPTVADGKVTRKVCYHWSSNCCFWANNIEVVNCGSYYVYKLGPTPSCNNRYCGSDY